MQCERDAAVRAAFLAVAVARVLDVLVAVFRVEGNEAQSVGEEFVGEDRGVLFDFDQVDGHRWDFGEDDSAEGVGEGEIDGAEFEIHAVWLGLGQAHQQCPSCRLVCFSIFQGQLEHTSLTVTWGPVGSMSIS